MYCILEQPHMAVHTTHSRYLLFITRIATVKRIYPISENKQDAKHIMREVRLMRFLGRMCTAGPAMPMHPRYAWSEPSHSTGIGCQAAVCARWAHLLPHH